MVVGCWIVVARMFDGSLPEIGDLAALDDPDALAKVDTEVAAAVAGWGSLSVAKTEQAIDYWVDRYDPHALRRTELSAQSRNVHVVAERDGTGLSWIDGSCSSQDAAALDQRLDAMARAVCDVDPRTLEQRRADAFRSAGPRR